MDRGWTPPVQVAMSSAVEHCVWSLWHNGADIAWQAGPAEALVAQVSGLQAQLAGPELLRWRQRELVLVRVHRGRPEVRGLGIRMPHLEADWKLTAHKAAPPGFVPDDDPDGVARGDGFRGPPGGHVLVSFRVDVWLWRLERSELVFPEGVVVQDVSADDGPSRDK